MSARKRPVPNPHKIDLYDMLCEIVHAIKDDPEATDEMKALARRGRKTLNAAKKAWYGK